MIKTIYICNKCGKQKTDKQDISGYYVPDGWELEFYSGKTLHYCCKKCKPRRKVKYVPYKNDDPGVGVLYGRT